MYLGEEENQVDHIFIVSHPIIHLDCKDYIDDDLLLDIPNVVMDDPFNDSRWLDTNFDLDE